MMRKIKKIGQIELSDTVVVSDPTYELGIWCQGIIKNVLTGIYNCYIEISDENEWGLRCSGIFAINEDYELEESDYRFDTREEFEVGVDSAQAGIFDLDYYQKTHMPDSSEEWDEEIFEITTNKNKGGIIDKKGFVARSGFGDGAYDCCTAIRDGKVVGIELVFIE